MATNSRLYIPALGGIYESLSPYMEPLLRIVAGLLLIPHGLPKVGLIGSGGIAGAAQFLEKVGYYPGMFWAAVLIVLELVGGVLFAVGLFTRLIAFLLVIEFINILYVQSPRGWSAMEYPLLWLIVFLYFMIRGGGPYSVDRKIGREF
jgi:putative oxidoreductase